MVPGKQAAVPPNTTEHSSSFIRADDGEELAGKKPPVAFL